MRNVKKVFNYDLVKLFLLNSVSPYAWWRVYKSIFVLQKCTYRALSYVYSVSRFLRRSLLAQRVLVNHNCQTV